MSGICNSDFLGVHDRWGPANIWIVKIFIKQNIRVMIQEVLSHKSNILHNCAEYVIPWRNCITLLHDRNLELMSTFHSVC